MSEQIVGGPVASAAPAGASQQSKRHQRVAAQGLGAPAGWDRMRPYLLVGPAVLLLLAVAVYPVLAAIGLSLRRSILVFGEDRFVGLGNYAFLLRDARFLAALGHTAYFALLSVTLELALGLGFALLLARATPGRGLLRAAVLVPWAIPTVVSATLWARLYNPDHGPIGALFTRAGVDLLGMPLYALHAAIVVDVWKTTPFVTLLLLAGLKAIPPELYEAAAVDGATGLAAFRRVTLPLLRPVLLVTLLFRTLDAFRVFDAVYVLTEGGPANSTETLSIYAYKTLMRVGDFGYGSTLAVVTFLLVLALSLLYLRVARPAGEEQA